MAGKRDAESLMKVEENNFETLSPILSPDVNSMSEDGCGLGGAGGPLVVQAIGSVSEDQQESSDLSKQEDGESEVSFEAVDAQQCSESPDVWKPGITGYGALEELPSPDEELPLLDEELPGQIGLSTVHERRRIFIEQKLAAVKILPEEKRVIVEGYCESYNEFDDAQIEQLLTNISASEELPDTSDAPSTVGQSTGKQDRSDVSSAVVQSTRRLMTPPPQLRQRISPRKVFIHPSLNEAEDNDIDDSNNEVFETSETSLENEETNPDPQAIPRCDNGMTEVSAPDADDERPTTSRQSLRDAQVSGCHCAKRSGKTTFCVNPEIRDEDNFYRIKNQIFCDETNLCVHCLLWVVEINLSKYESQFKELSFQPLEMVANPDDNICIRFTTPEGHQYYIGEEKEEVFKANYFKFSNCKVFVFRIDPSPDKIDHKYIDFNYCVSVNFLKEQKIQFRMKNMERHKTSQPDWRTFSHESHVVDRSVHIHHGNESTSTVARTVAQGRAHVEETNTNGKSYFSKP